MLGFAGAAGHTPTHTSMDGSPLGLRFARENCNTPLNDQRQWNPTSRPCFTSLPCSGSESLKPTLLSRLIKRPLPPRPCPPLHPTPLPFHGRSHPTVVWPKLAFHPALQTKQAPEQHTQQRLAALAPNLCTASCGRSTETLVQAMRKIRICRA